MSTFQGLMRDSITKERMRDVNSHKGNTLLQLKEIVKDCGHAEWTTYSFYLTNYIPPNTTGNPIRFFKEIEIFIFVSTFQNLLMIVDHMT